MPSGMTATFAWWTSGILSGDNDRDNDHDNDDDDNHNNNDYDHDNDHFAHDDDLIPITSMTQPTVPSPPQTRITVSGTSRNIWRPA